MPLLRTYVRVSFRFYSKSEPYYEFSGSVFTKRVNKKNVRVGRAYFYKNIYVVNKENVRLRQTIDFVVNQILSQHGWCLLVASLNKLIMISV